MKVIFTFQQNAAAARRQNSEGASDGGAPSGGSGCVSVESEGEQLEEEGEEETGVRFRVEEEPGPEADKMRLHRRDTPHHLKNKRINNQPVRRHSCTSTIRECSCLALEFWSRTCY